MYTSLADIVAMVNTAMDCGFHASLRTMAPPKASQVQVRSCDLRLSLDARRLSEVPWVTLAEVRLSPSGGCLGQHQPRRRFHHLGSTAACRRADPGARSVVAAAVDVTGIAADDRGG